MNRSTRDISRQVYVVPVGENNAIAQGDVNAGSLQRIADACETMAKDRERMEASLDWHRHDWKKRGEEIAALKRSNAALRGVITKQRMAMEDLVEKYNCMVMQRGQEREATT